MSIAEKLTTVAENQQRVYDAGYSAGQQAGGDGDNYYDELWDSLQANGTRTNYSNAFGKIWNDENFKPKYDIRPNNATTMFENSGIKDLKGVLDSLGLVLDFSGVTNGWFVQFLQQSSITRIGRVDMTGSYNATTSYAFYGARNLEYVEAVVLSDTGEQILDEKTTFGHCNVLKEIRFEGKIGCSLSFQYSPLSRASIENIVSVLSDTVTGQTVTFKQSAVDAAFSSEEWTALTAAKPNWEVKCV